LSKMRRKMRSGEQVLDEHLFDGLIFEVGVDGLAAKLGEGVETFDEGRVGFALVRDEGHGAFGNVGDSAGELAGGLVPAFVKRLVPFKEKTQHVYRGFRAW